MGAKPRFETLDGLRGVAAFAVFSLHGHVLLGARLLPSAYMAVDFFFILSGFVLAHAYGEALQARRLSILAFMRERVIRLYPLYALASALSLLVLIGGSIYGRGSLPSLADLACGLLFLPSPSLTEAAAFPLLFVAWSLFYELAANLLYALLAPHLTTRRTAALVAFGAVTLIATAVWFGSLDVGSKTTDFAGGAARVTFGFFAGGLLYRVWRSGKLVLPHVHVGLIGVALIAGLGFAQGVYAQLAVAVLLMPGIVLLGAHSRAPGAVGRACRFAGAASYPLYVLHLPLISLANSLAKRAGQTIGPAQPVLLAAFLAAVLMAVTLADQGWDRPARRWLRATLAPGKTAPQVVVQ